MFDSWFSKIYHWYRV